VTVVASALAGQEQNHPWVLLTFFFFLDP